MKKALLIIIILFVPIFIKAATCDVEKISIDSISVEKSIGGTFEKSDATISGNKINLDLSMNNVGDSITYKIAVRNDSNEDFELDDSSMEKASDYIEYSFNNSDSVTVKANSTKVVLLKVEYKNPIPASVLVGDTYNENEDLLLSLSTLTNPKTGDTRVILISIALVFSVILFIILKKGSKASLLSILVLLIIIPLVINAACKVEIEISSNVEIKKIAEFDIGSVVNKKIKILAGWVDHGPGAYINDKEEPKVLRVNSDDDEEGDGFVIKSFKRSQTLPDDIKALVDEELNDINNTDVSQEVNQRIEEIKNNNQIIDYVHIKEEDGVKIFCANFEEEEMCADESDIEMTVRQSENQIMIIVENNEYTYLVYDDETNSFNIWTEEEYKDVLARKIISGSKDIMSKNILSSEDSNYIIYGWYDKVAKEIYYYCEKELVYLNSDSSEMFSGIRNLKSVPGLLEADASRVENMSRMFYSSGIFNTDLSSLNLSNVTDMSEMFYGLSCHSSTPNGVLNLSNLNVSNVKNMRQMFMYVGSGCESLTINLSNWDTSSVTDMSGMFSYAYREIPTANIDLTNLNVSNVKNMKSMFERFGEYSTNVQINLSNFNSSSVTDMSQMFANVGSYSKTVNLNLSGMNTSNVTNMASMFSSLGPSGGNNDAAVLNVDISSWNTSKVEDMSHMFDSAGRYVKNVSITGLSNFRTSNVKDMNHMFNQFGESIPSFSLDISSWDTSKVENMSTMFRNAGNKSTSFELDLSNWNTSKVTTMAEMFAYTGQNATSWTIGDLSRWDTSKVENMYLFFVGCGNKAETFNLGNLSNWNTSNVKDMTSMFAFTGKNSSTWYIGDLSSWNVSSVETMSGMFNGSGQSAETWSIGDLSSWDTSKVTVMVNMFKEAGRNAVNWVSIGTLNVYADNIRYLFCDSINAKGTINIRKNSSNYSYAFQNSATKTDASIVVNYTDVVTNINAIVNTKSSNSHVTKGNLLTD